MSINIMTGQRINNNVLNDTEKYFVKLKKYLERDKEDLKLYVNKEVAGHIVITVEGNPYKVETETEKLKRELISKGVSKDYIWVNKFNFNDGKRPHIEVVYIESLLIDVLSGFYENIRNITWQRESLKVKYTKGGKRNE